MAVHTDLVTIRFRHNTSRVPIFTGFCVIGSASPCRNLLVINGSVRRVSRCLRRNGFVLLSSHRNSLLFRRTRLLIDQKTGLLYLKESRFFNVMCPYPTPSHAILDEIAPETAPSHDVYPPQSVWRCRYSSNFSISAASHQNAQSL